MDVSVWMGPHLRGPKLVLEPATTHRPTGPGLSIWKGPAKTDIPTAASVVQKDLAPVATVPVVEPLFVGYIPCFCTGYKWPQNDCSCQRKSCHLQLGHHLDMSLSEDLGENM